MSVAYWRLTRQDLSFYNVRITNCRLHIGDKFEEHQYQIQIKNMPSIDP